MRNTWVVLTGLAAIAGGCEGPAPELATIGRPIVAGTPSTGDPAIMEVLSFRGQLGARCTASLVTPRILLLAAHCFVETPGFPQRFVYPGNDDRNVPDKDLIPIKTFVYDPQYTTPRQGHDFAVVVLDTPSTVRPLPINRASLAQAQGKTVRYVGYGLTTVGDPNSGGIKRQNTAPLAQVSNLLLSIDRNAHPACEGDSGGPLLYDDGKGESIVGVASFVTNPACQRESFYQRLDTQLGWVEAQIQKYDPGGMAPAADAGVDGAPASADAGASDRATTPAADAQPADAAAAMVSPADAAPRDLAPSTTEPEEPPPRASASSGGCSYAPEGRVGGAVLLLGLVIHGLRRRARRTESRRR
jgi:V8-like Glu-specific endopeptidase